MEDMISVINEQYLADDAVYARVEDGADPQVKFYIIPQDDKYRPFDMESWKVDESFQEEQLSDFRGFFFRFSCNGQTVWGYQNKRSTTLANHKKTSLIARVMQYEKNEWIFEEQKEKLVSFAHVIDILIIDGHIITGDVGLLQRSFEFQIFIEQKAREAAEKIKELTLFDIGTALDDYISSDAKSHKPYVRKLMRAVDSPVLQMSSKNLNKKVRKLDRWKGKFKVPDKGPIPIKKVKEIEAMIDLLAERFTVSQVSRQEYDTVVKKKAAPV